MMTHHSGIQALEEVHLAIGQKEGPCQHLRSEIKHPVTVSLERLQQEE